VRETLLLIELFLREYLVKRIETFLAPMVSQSIALAILIYGFSGVKAVVNLPAVVATGWLPVNMLVIAMATVILTVVELKTRGISFLLSLPVSPKQIVIARLMASSIAAVIMSLGSLIIAQFTVLRFGPLQIVLTLLILFAASLGILGIALSLLTIVKDVFRLALIAPIMSTLLHYISPLYYPIEVFPREAIPLMMLNPVTPPMLSIRALLDGAPNESTIFVITPVVSVAWLVIGTVTLYNRILMRE
jgi:ABC-type polysaccharide/polyol phosphate export permease